MKLLVLQSATCKRTRVLEVLNLTSWSLDNFLDRDF